MAGRTAARVEAGEAGATVLRLDGDDPLYLKYGESRVACDIADEYARLVWLGDRLPCPRVRWFGAAGDRAWLLTEALPGRTGDAWLEAGPTHLPMVIDAAADFQRRLHALPVDDCPFDAGAAVRIAAARRNLADGLVDTDDFADNHEGWSAEAMMAEVERLRPAAGERVVTHGDFSLGNLLIGDDGRVVGCIDVGRLGVADPYQDIAILWENLREFGAEWSAMLLERLGIVTPDEQRLAFHRALDEMF